MSKVKHIILITILALISASVSGGEIKPPIAIKEQAKTFHPELAFSLIDTTELPNDPYMWTRYRYSKDGEWPYGVVYILWRSDTSTPIWGLDWPGDFQIHSLAREDFNGDGRKDLFFFAGFEDVFSTHVYVWNGESTSYSRDNMYEVYKNKNDYSVVMDIEGDGRPEILDSGHTGDIHIDNLCRDDGSGYAIIPSSIRTKVEKKYHELVGKFDKLNFTYNMPEHYAVMNMSIIHPIKIMRIEGDVAKDVTPQYQLHLQWRLNVLRKIRDTNKGGCKQLVDSVIDYIQKRLSEAQPSRELKPTTESSD